VSEQRKAARMVEMKISVPLLTYRLLQHRAEAQRLQPTTMAQHQLIKVNDPGLRQERKLDLRQEIFNLWRRGKTGPQISIELGCSVGTVNKHKREIRDNYATYAGEADLA
jgi:DNA-binding NarL/FixJ family response regulator